MSVRRPNFQEEASAEAINISPLIDVIFILLIFFIVTMVFADGSAMKVDVPEASNAQPVDEKATNIYIGSDGEVSLDGTRYSVASLSGPLKRKLSERPVLIVRSDSKVPVSRLVEVMDCAKENGAKEIYVAAQKK